MFDFSYLPADFRARGKSAAAEVTMFSDAISLPTAIRDQLVAIGIPAAQHTPEALTDLFPREFKIKALGLDAEDIARVLVHLVGQKIIILPGKAAPRCTKPVAPGWHACHFYHNFSQLLEIVAPYIAEGLKNGEGCLWVLPAAVSKKDACTALARCVQDVDGYFTRGQLEILSHPDWYLDAAGRLKSFEEIAKALLEKQDLALARGFKFLRAAGDTGWVSGTEESKDFIDYEMKVNAALGATKVAAICTYRADVTADELLAIIAAHQDAVFAPAC